MPPRVRLKSAALAVALSTLIAGCCHPTRILVPVTPRPCLTRAAPRPTVNHEADYAALVRWAIAAELACGVPVPDEAPVEDDGGEAVR